MLAFSVCWGFLHFLSSLPVFRLSLVLFPATPIILTYGTKKKKNKKNKKEENVQASFTTSDND